MNKNILKMIGLSDQESRIYLALLEIREASIVELSRASGLHRPTLYRLLPKMKAKGLISETKKGKRIKYLSEHPRKIRDLYERSQDEVAQAIEEMEAIYALDQAPVIKVLDGQKGLKFIFSDILSYLKRGDIFYRYSSSTDMKRGGGYLPKNYRKKRDAKQLERFVITSEGRANTKKKRLGRAVKIVPKEFGLFNHNITQIIYGDKVAFIDYNSETALLIENKKMADFQKQLFKMLYSKL